MVKGRFLFGLLAVVGIVASSVAAFAIAIVDFIGSPFATKPLGFSAPAGPVGTLADCWTDPFVDRHEAGVSRRSAARNC